MSLCYQVYVTPGLPAIGEPPPDRAHKTWSPTAATLVMDDRDAVIVDTFFAAAQVEQLIDWIRASGRRLVAIYSTHGHGDHFFGAGMILTAFPDARFYATPPAIQRMRREAGEAGRQHWETLFPGQVAPGIVIAVPAPEGGIALGDHRLVPVDVGHTDTDGTSVLHVPDLDLIVAGDVVYDGVHQYLAEGSFAEWDRWLAALDRVDALCPRRIVCGHKRPGSDDGAHTIGETRRYIRDFAELARTGASANDLYRSMIERHPDRMNVGALWDSVAAFDRSRKATQQENGA